MEDKDFLYRGGARVFGDNVDTDAIIPAQYLILAEEKEIAAHCMEEESPGFPTRVKPGDVLVAGENFGCGSSREHAPVAIRGCGIACVVAKSFSRLFYRNAVNIGLPVIAAAGLPPVAEGEEIAVDCISGSIRLLKSGAVIAGSPLPGFMLEILRAGGLYGYLEKRLREQGRFIDGR